MSTTTPDTPETPGPAGNEPAGTAARRARQQARRAAGSSSSPTTAAGSAGSRGSAGSSATPAPGAADRSPASTPIAGAHRAGRELDPDALAALEEERSFLLGSLDDLERERDAGDVDDVDYVALKDDYTARAATVIRAIEHREAAFARARPPKKRGRTLAWVAALLVLSVGLGVIVAQSSGRRDAGDSISGDIRQTNRDLLLQAGSAAAEQRFVDAIALYDEVLANQPASTEALTYKAWVLFLTSRATEDPADTQILLARANELLDQAIEIDPAYGDARAFRANVLNARGYPDQALADLDAIEPGALPADMDVVVDSLRSRLEAQLGGTTTGSAAPAPPAAGTP